MERQNPPRKRPVGIHRPWGRCQSSGLCFPWVMMSAKLSISMTMARREDVYTYAQRTQRNELNPSVAARGLRGPGQVRISTCSHHREGALARPEKNGCPEWTQPEGTTTVLSVRSSRSSQVLPGPRTFDRMVRWIQQSRRGEGLVHRGARLRAGDRVNLVDEQPNSAVRQQRTPFLFLFKGLYITTTALLRMLHYKTRSTMF